MESKAHRGATRAADEDTDAVSSAADTTHGGQDVLGVSGGHDGPGDAISPGVPGDPGDLANPRGHSTVGESGGTTSAIPQIPGPPQAPGPGGDAAPRAGVLSNPSPLLLLLLLLSRYSRSPGGPGGHGGRSVS